MDCAQRQGFGAEESRRGVRKVGRGGQRPVRTEEATYTVTQSASFDLSRPLRLTAGCLSCHEAVTAILELSSAVGQVRIGWVGGVRVVAVRYV